VFGVEVRSSISDFTDFSSILSFSPYSSLEKDLVHNGG
jgi:hypothetical protein